MYHENHAINDAVLTIINDGNGSQCGLTYDQRCKLAAYGLLEYVNAAKHYNPRLKRGEARIVGELVQAYYQEHVKEL